MKTPLDDGLIRRKRRGFKNSFFAGFLAGLLCPPIGALLHYLVYWEKTSYPVSIEKYIAVAMKSAEVMTGLLSLGGFVSLAMFFLLLKIGWPWSARALIISMFVYVFAIGAIKIFGIA